ncbi:MAG TPA: hypothetical protein PLH94_06890 [Fimbriimonadaceae bacterium]|nr:hypothetical protein [Fimbriimonadaceae bacterium]
MQRLTHVLAVSLLVGLVAAGCGGGSSPVPAATYSGVYRGTVDLPGIGVSDVLLSLEGRGAKGVGKIISLTGNRQRRATFSSFSNSSNRSIVTAPLLNGPEHQIEVRPVGDSPVPSQVQVTVSRGGQSSEATLSRSGSFARAGDPSPFAPNASYNVSASGDSFSFTITSASPDGTGGWNLSGLAYGRGGEMIFGDQGIQPSNFSNGLLVIQSVGGQFLCDGFDPGSGGTGTVFTLQQIYGGAQFSR